MLQSRALAAAFEANGNTNPGNHVSLAVLPAAIVRRRRVRKQAVDVRRLVVGGGRSSVGWCGK
jgi:hypothetical protein